MKNSFHPYAIIFAIVIGIFVLATLRHPLFSLFAAVVALVGFDQAFKSGKLGSKKSKKISKDTDKETDL